MSDLPSVTIGMPCLNEEAYIEECVRCALEQDYPADKLEVVVADGGSTDRTLEMLRKLSGEDARVRVIGNPGRYQSAGMNEIVKVARGEYVVRLDVHGFYAKDYVRSCIEELRRTGADNVGGAARPLSRNWFQRALCAALHSPLGVGGSAYRSEKNEGFVETVFNGAFHRSLFERVGLWDPKAVTNEDAELNQRILEAGGRIYLSRRIHAFYYPRDSYRGLARQYFKYGMGRARTLLKHGRLPSVRPVIPFLLVAGGATLLLVPPLQVFAPGAFLAYALATGAEAVRVGRKAGWWAIPVVWSQFPIMHVCHGTGLARGLVHYWRHPDWALRHEHLDSASAARETRSPEKRRDVSTSPGSATP